MVENDSQKLGNMTTMDISMENKGKLHGVATQLEQILRKKKVSLDEVVSVLLAIKPLDVVLLDMMLEDEPEWQSKKKKTTK